MKWKQTKKQFQDVLKNGKSRELRYTFEMHATGMLFFLLRNTGFGSQNEDKANNFKAIRTPSPFKKSKECARSTCGGFRNPPLHPRQQYWCSLRRRHKPRQRNLARVKLALSQLAAWSVLQPLSRSYGWKWKFTKGREGKLAMHWFKE